MAGLGAILLEAQRDRLAAGVETALRIEERIYVEQMAELAERVDRLLLVEHVLEQGLETGEALAAGAATVGLNGAIAVV